MNGKNEREILMEEFKRINREKFEKFYGTICESFDDFLNRQSLAKDDWEMKCPYEEGDKVFKLGDDGLSWRYRWDCMGIDESRFEQGNIFPTEQAAELESKRRNLLTRFKAFRDECNGEWKADWADISKPKFFRKYI